MTDPKTPITEEKTTSKTTTKTTATKNADEAKAPEITFRDFDLNPKLIQALDDKGYTTPTEIQSKTLQAFSSGKHIVGQSQTGTGKTAAFLLPVLNKINSRIRSPQVLVLAPTRELASQIRDEVFELSKHMFMRSVTVTG